MDAKINRTLWVLAVGAILIEALVAAAAVAVLAP